MKIKDGFVLRSIAGTHVVVPTGDNCLNFNGMITLNDSAAFLWRVLQEGSDVEGMTKALLGEYEVDEETARSCSESFLKKLVEAKCVE
ncbi:MAG: PqqD family protein [Oscillospiraceae bacterium]|jgi:hypothetical protein|nr:PqqD family protein [Oscillospiraceae bacterium]